MSLFKTVISDLLDIVGLYGDEKISLKELYGFLYEASENIMALHQPELRVYLNHMAESLESVLYTVDPDQIRPRALELVGKIKQRLLQELNQ